jgi:hypothetical protein
MAIIIPLKLEMNFDMLALIVGTILTLLGILIAVFDNSYTVITLALILDFVLFAMSNDIHHWIRFKN